MWLQLSPPFHKCHTNHFLWASYSQRCLYCRSVLTRCDDTLLTGQFPLTFPPLVIIWGGGVVLRKPLKATVLTRVQSRSAQIRNLWPQLLSLRGRPKVHRKHEPRKEAALRHLPNTGCRTGWSGHASDQEDKGKNKQKNINVRLLWEV